MGKRGGRRGGRGRGGWGRGGGGPPRRAERSQRQEIERRNAHFEKYYNELGIIPESERDDFWTALRRDLPNSFRFTGSKAHALAVQEKLKDFYIPEITSIRHEGEFVEAPKPVEWFPDQLAWYMTVPKSVIRRFAPFASFQKFLVAETEVGNISRQEVVSMIPPLLMDIRPGMTVLDMCAAPGSKSAQLIEMVHAGEEDRTRSFAEKARQGLDVPSGLEWEDDGRATGLLVANDVDYKRAHMLVHQMKRLSSPNIIVTNHDATAYPSIKLSSPRGKYGEVIPNKYLKFDRILADVPCTGDGTARKNIEIWRAWTPQNALGLHLTQNRILVRALQMLKVGGRVIYSTCSMNPVEDEAVVASSIHRCGGVSKVEIKDCSYALPGLKRFPGLRQWRVMDRQDRMWNTYLEVDEHRKAEGITGLGRLNETMFPPEDEILRLSLDRCLRIYPHSQDTGAFFIAVLEKKSEIRALRPESEYRKVETTDDSMQKARNEQCRLPKTETGSLESQLSSLQSEALDEVFRTVDFQNAQNGNASPLKFELPEAGQQSTALHMNDGHDAQSDVVSGAAAKELQSMSTIGSKRNREYENDEETPLKQIRLSNRGDMTYQVVPETRKSESEEGDEWKAKEIVDTQAPSNNAHLMNEANEHAAASVLSKSIKSNEDAENNADSHFKSNSLKDATQKPKNKQPFEEPFKYLRPDMGELEFIRQFYDVSSRFPQDRFMVRNASGTATKNVYYTTNLAKSILQENEGTGMKFVHAGVKMFVKQDVPRPEVCPWRIQTDGISIIEAWVGECRIVHLKRRETLRKLLVEMFPSFEGDNWKELGEVGEQVKDLPLGCCVLRIEPGEGDDCLSERMVFPLWRSIKSLNLMLSKEDRKAMLLRLFNDNTPLINQSLQKQQATQEAPAKANTSSPEPERMNGAETKVGTTEVNLLDAIEIEVDQPPDDETLNAAQAGEDGPFNQTPLT